MKIKIQITALFVLFSLKAFSQSLYDKNHSFQFAEYLFNSKQYKFAAEEYERVLFLDSTDFKAQKRILQSYRLGGDAEKGILKARNFFGNNLPNLSDSLAREYTMLLIDASHFQEAQQFVTRNKNLQREFKGNYELALFLISKDWDQAAVYLSRYPEAQKLNTSIVSLTADAQMLNYKSPALAVTLSAILPGAGKFYCKRWQDGLISMIFFATTSVAAYRGFSIHGTESVYGYFFSAMAIGLYSGNIYGTYKAAKNYNDEIEDDIAKKAESALRTAD